jgi:hypothetical protein
VSVRSCDIAPSPLLSSSRGPSPIRPPCEAEALAIGLPRYGLVLRIEGGLCDGEIEA